MPTSRWSSKTIRGQITGWNFSEDRFSSTMFNIQKCSSMASKVNQCNTTKNQKITFTTSTTCVHMLVRIANISFQNPGQKHRRSVKEKKINFIKKSTLQCNLKRFEISCKLIQVRKRKTFVDERICISSDHIRRRQNMVYKLANYSNINKSTYVGIPFHYCC